VPPRVAEATAAPSRSSQQKQIIEPTNPLLALLQPKPQAPAARSEPLKARPPVRVRRKAASVPKNVKPQIVGEIIAIRKARTTRQSVIAFLHLSGMKLELQHLLELEERLTKRTMPAMFHAALSTRLLLQGVADHCFPAQPGKLEDRFGRCHQVEESNVGNRLAAYVDRRLGKVINDEEHRLFIATLDTVVRWGARGPHRIYDDAEAERFFLRLLDVLDTIGRAYFAQLPPSSALSS